MSDNTARTAIKIYFKNLIFEPLYMEFELQLFKKESEIDFQR